MKAFGTAVAAAALFCNVALADVDPIVISVSNKLSLLARQS